MNVVFFTTGMGAPKAAKNAIREKAPKLVRSIKNAGLLLPSCIQRPLLSGFTRERRFPSGLGYLSAMLKQRGHRVSLVDRFIEQQAWVDSLASVDFVGVHTTTPCFEDALAVVSRLEQEGYTGPIAFGGPHIALYPETAPPRVDYVVQGEAEYLIADLVEGVYAPSTLIQTPRIKDLDALPRVDYELFFDRPRPYELTMPFVDDKPIYNLTTSRSCPYKCTFCAVRSIWGRLWTAHSAERIVDDILYLKKTYDVAGIYFREDLFTTQKERVFEICNLLRKHSLNLPWACETRAEEATNKDMVEEMARSGCCGFYIGAESGSQRMLDLYNKEATVEDTINACSIAKKHNIIVAMSIIVADPHERVSDKLATWKMVRKCKPEILQTSVYYGEQTGLNELSYPTYEKRRRLNMEHINGTWRGQSDRAFFPIALSK